MITSYCWLGVLVLGQPLPLLPPPTQMPPAQTKIVTKAPAAEPLGEPRVGGSSGRKKAALSRAEVPQGEWQAPLRLTPALENVYRGTVNEECFTPQTQYARSYRLESRVLVLEPE